MTKLKYLEVVTPFETRRFYDYHFCRTVGNRFWVYFGNAVATIDGDWVVSKRAGFSV